MEQSQNVHAIDRVRPRALKKRVAVVKVAMGLKASYPELRAVCFDDCLSIA